MPAFRYPLSLILLGCAVSILMGKGKPLISRRVGAYPVGLWYLPCGRYRAISNLVLSSNDIALIWAYSCRNNPISPSEYLNGLCLRLCSQVWLQKSGIFQRPVTFETMLTVDSLDERNDRFWRKDCGDDTVWVS